MSHDFRQTFHELLTYTWSRDKEHDRNTISIAESFVISWHGKARITFEWSRNTIHVPCHVIFPLFFESPNVKIKLPCCDSWISVVIYSSLSSFIIRCCQLTTVISHLSSLSVIIILWSVNDGCGSVREGGRELIAAFVISEILSSVAIRGRQKWNVIGGT